MEMLNIMRKNKVYIKTKNTVSDKLKNELQSQSVKEVQKTMNLDTDDDYQKHRDVKQLNNIKYNLNKKDNTPSNTADSIIAVEEMVQTNEFVQNVQHITGISHPVITLYNNQQLTDINKFCCKPGGTVLGLDKNYNLGDFHVTSTCRYYSIT